jgi:hypothetical protein
MMETNGTDEQIRSLYRRLEPRVDAETFCRTLGTHMTPRTTRRTPRKLRRALVVACVVVVALAARPCSDRPDLEHYHIDACSGGSPCQSLSKSGLGQLCGALS